MNPGASPRSRRVLSRTLLFAFGLCALALAGSARAGERREAAVPVVVLAAEPSARSLASQLAEALAKRPLVAVMDAQAFVDGLFPWLEPSTLPADSTALTALMGRPRVREAIGRSGVDYLVLVRGSTTEGESHGGILCGAGYGGGGCLGLAWWDRNTQLGLALWDLRRFGAMDGVEIRRGGTSVVPAFVLPVPLLAATERPAIDEAAARVADIVTHRATTTEGAAIPR